MGITNFAKKILLKRNTLVFVMVGTLLFSLCIFILMEALYVLLGIVVVLIICVVAESQTTTKKQYVVYDGGNEYRLEYDSYKGFGGVDVYKDQFGGYWETANNGSTFYRVS